MTDKIERRELNVIVEKRREMKGKRNKSENIRENREKGAKSERRETRIREERCKVQNEKWKRRGER